MRKGPCFARLHGRRFAAALCLFVVCLFLQVLSFPVYGKAKNALDLLQFTSKGHVLGFSHGSMYLASADHMVKVDFVGGKPVAPVACEASLDGGALPLSKVSYSGVWDGIDIVYEKAGGSIVKSTYTVSGGGVPGSIRLRYNRPLTTDDGGSLVIRYDTGRMTESRPVAWQVVNGTRKPVMVAYALHSEREAGFIVGDYDRSLPLVIDPSFTWNTFLGGSDDDGGRAIAVDSSGNVYVAGGSAASWGSPKRAFTTSCSDAFAAKLTSEGVLEWNTFLGGDGTDYGYAIAVDEDKLVYVVGLSDASWGASPKRAYGLNNDAFAAKLSNAGVLEWNTFLGGDGDDYGQAIAVSTDGYVYVAGYSDTAWGSPKRDYTDGDDAFAARLSATDGDLSWNTFLGGSDDDAAHGIAVDSGDYVYVAGTSTGTWQDTGNPPKRAFSGISDAFAAKVSKTDGGLTWNTFLGGDGVDAGLSIAMDSGSYVYVAGTSTATWGDSPKRAYSGDDDAFAAKVSKTDGTLAWNTFLGGSDTDSGSAIAVDSGDYVYVTGYSYDTWGSPLRLMTEPPDAFAAKLSKTDGALTWSTFLGGSGNDFGEAIAVDSSGNVHVAGTSDATWGTSPKRAYTGGDDAFVVKLPDSPSLISLLSFTASAFSAGVTLSWETGSEIDTTGFNVWRSSSREGSYTLITGLIPSEGSASQGASYSYTDGGLAAGAYYYKLEDLDTNGASTFHGPVSARVGAVLVLVSPADTAPFPALPPAFTWEGEGVTKSRLQFCPDSSFRKGVISISADGTGYTPNILQWKRISRLMKKSGSLYWRVSGRDKADKGKTVVSESFRFSGE